MRKTLLWTGQVVLLAVVAVYFWRTLGPNWQKFSSLRVALDIRPGWLLLSALTVWATYAVLIEAWRQVLRGWEQHLSYAAAARIWALSNLGRYLPGKLWSVAGMAVMAQKAGIAGWAAVASSVVLQALAVGTGAIAVGAAAPGTQSPLRLALAGALALAAMLPFLFPKAGQRLARLVRPDAELKPVRPAALLGGALATLASWIAYGCALWLLARGLFPGVTLSVSQAIGAFAAAYVVGLLALFAPGGFGVREGVLTALLTPVMGYTAALTLTVASRILLTITEGGAALGALLLRGTIKENVR